MSAQRPVRTPQTFRERLNLRIRDAVGLTQDPPPICNDPALAYFPVNGVARLVHGDLTSMIVGGLGSLFLQMLHPHAMAGVAQHSRYQQDAAGRLLQTANFIGHTTYGTKTAAFMDIERVRAVHEAVVGVADDGVAYSANDPHLLLWVHACEALMFLDAYRAYGTVPLSASSLDEYVNEMAQLGRDLGIAAPPTTYAGLLAAFEDFRPELRLYDDGRVARDFLFHDYAATPLQRWVMQRFIAASLRLMPSWAIDLLEVDAPRPIDTIAGEPILRLLGATTRFFVPPVAVERS
jgi:uncharacterized protein (DUF2236 family)